MRSGFDLADELAAGVRDADGAWRFVRRFADAWAGPIVEGDGCAADELAAAEARIGLLLPVSLWRMFELIGRRDDLTRRQDRLLAPDQLRLDDSGDVLVFRVENQNVAQWGIRLAEMGHPDPPVVFRLDSLHPEERTWQTFLDRVSLACMEMVLSEWMLSSEDLADNRELDTAAVEALEARFARLPMPDYPLWAEPHGAPTRWFGGEDVVLREDAGAWVWVRAVSAQRLADVRLEMPGDLLMADV